MRDWAKMQTKWNRRKKLRPVLRKYGPVAGAYYLHLLALAKEFSHHVDNPLGEFTCSRHDLADDLYDDHDRADLLEAFKKRGIIDVKSGGANWLEDADAEVTFSLPEFVAEQQATGSPGDRKAKERFRNTKNSADEENPEIAGKCHSLSQPVTNGRLDRDRDRDRDSEPPRVHEREPAREAGSPSEGSFYIGKALDWVRRKHPPMSHHVYERVAEIMRDEMLDPDDPPKSLKYWTTRSKQGRGLSRAEQAFAQCLEEGAKHSVDSVNRAKEQQAEKAKQDSEFMDSFLNQFRNDDEGAA